MSRFTTIAARLSTRFVAALSLTAALNVGACARMHPQESFIHEPDADPVVIEHIEACVPHADPAAARAA